MSLDILFDIAVRVAGTVAQIVVEGVFHWLLDPGPAKRTAVRRPPTVIFSRPRASRRR